MAIKVRKKGTDNWVFVAGLGRPGKDGGVGPVGPQGLKGDIGPQGPAGTDGLSPTVTVMDIPGGSRVTITDADGPHSFDVMDGQGNGVSTFNGRTGTVVPSRKDYTAEMVGAIPIGDIDNFLVCTQDQYDTLTEKNSKTLYLIQEE